jgi:hypothetical protein
VRLGRKGWTWTNDDEAPPVTGLGRRLLPAVLADVLAFRSRQTADGPGDDATIVLRGVAPWFTLGWPVAEWVAADVAAGHLDMGRVAYLLGGFLLLDWEYSRPPSGGLAPSRSPGASDGVVVPVQRLLAPFFSPRPVALKRPGQDQVNVRLRPEAGWARLLASDRTGDVVRAALGRLRTAGLAPALGAHDVSDRRGSPTGRRPSALTLTAAVQGPDLATALLVHLRGGDYAKAVASSTVPLDVPTEEELPDG